jgi:outer membrane biosynthesis protein TonB
MQATMSYPLRAAVVLLSLSSFAACAKTPVRAPVAPPALAVPTPDARLVLPAPPVEAPPEPPPPPDPAPVAATPPRPRETNTRPPQTATPPSQQTAPPQNEAPPPQVLQTTANVSGLQKRAEDLVAAAERDLGKVRSGELGRDARVQFDNAWRFVWQAKQALKAKNYVWAFELADKAATLATLLVRGD